MKLLLTVESAAEMLGVSRSVLYQMIGSEEIESVKIGRSRRIPVIAVENFVEQLRKGRH
jgi:excisionase family DNA binding protein